MSKRIRGFTLIEVLVALAIGVLIAAGIAQATEAWGRSVANEAAAQHARTVKRAAQAYIADAYGALVAAAGPSSPATITPAQLAAGDYLPEGFNPVNGFGQDFLVRVIEPTPGQLDAIVLTRGGDRLDGQSLRRIAQLIGVDGGYVTSGASNAVAQGAFGGWSRNLAPFGGSLGADKLAIALFVSDAAGADDMLHRAATAGQPELNRMGTAIDMDGHDIDRAATVDADRLELPSGNSLRVGGIYYYGDSANAAVRVNGGLYVQQVGGGAAPINQVGSIASQGTVSANDVSASGTVSGASIVSNESYANGWFRSQGNGGWYSSAYGGGWHMTDPTWIRAYNSKNVYTPGQFYGGSVASNTTITAGSTVSAGQTVQAGVDVSAGRNIAASSNVYANGSVNAGANVDAGGRVTAGEYLLPRGVGTCGATCSPNGLIGRTSQGAMLSCTNGAWRGQGC